MKNPPPLEIARPCPKDWDDMHGDAQRRFCDHCQLHVHNLSAMSTREYGRFHAETGGRACIAYEMRDDGTPIHPSRWPRLARTFARLAAMLAAAMPLALTSCASRRMISGTPLPPAQKTADDCFPSQPRTLGRPAISPDEAAQARQQRRVVPGEALPLALQSRVVPGKPAPPSP